MKRIAALLALLLAAGCARPVPPPSDSPAPAPVQAQTEPAPKAEPSEANLPEFRQAVLVLYEEYPKGGGAVTGELPLTGSLTAVPAEPFILRVELKGPAPEEWVRSIRVTGTAVPAPEPAGLPAGMVVLRFPPGEPGARLTLTLPESRKSPAVTYEMMREERQRASIDVFTGGQWQAGAADQVYPTGPLAVRLTFSAPMDRVATEVSLRQRVPYADLPALPDVARLTWTDDKTLDITMEQAPPVIQFNLKGARTAGGLPLGTHLPVLHFGTQPQLVAIGPATLAETALAGLPPEVTSVQVGPDGKQALVSSYFISSGGYNPTAQDLWLVDLSKGERGRIDGGFHSFLGPDRTVRRIDATACLSAADSPDRTRIAALKLNRWSPEDHYHYYDLLILDLEGKELQRIPEFVRVWGPPKDWSMYAPLTWAPDSKRVASISMVPEKAYLAVANLTAGTVWTSRSLENAGDYPQLAWDGARFLVNGQLLDAEGKPLRKLPAHGSFSPDGKWVLGAVPDERGGPWGAIRIINPATGEVRSAGEGLPAGWTPDGKALVVRWPEYQHRYIVISPL